jgi:ABC-2 type transport system permease protein
VALTLPTPRPQRNSGSLVGLKMRALYNTFARGSKVGYVLVALFVALVAWAEFSGTIRAMTFLCEYGRLPFLEKCSLVGRSVAQRTLEIGLIVLASGVTFSAITTAITTLYASDDLNFLLSQPIQAWRVFAVKLAETYQNAAGVPALLTLPIIVGLGAYWNAPIWYYALSALAALIVYALPVGLGAATAVVLMRFAPAGRVREVATGLGVVLSASLVYFIRAARPEDLLKQLQDPNAFDTLLQQFAAPSNPFLPPSWAARVIWDGARGDFAYSFFTLVGLALIVLLAAGWLAAKAYQEGWVRGLESSRVKLDRTPRGASFTERFFTRFGPSGVLIVKDARLLFRDATQWSQLLILVALGGVYLVSVRSFPVQEPLFRNVMGFLTLAFQGFVIAGVGIRMAFPSVSLEGAGYWLLRTGPMTARSIVMAKYWGALPATLVLAVAMGFVSARILELAPVMVLLSVLVSFSSALSITALGVGLGAALPRFKHDNPAEVAVSPGGLLYMLLSLVYSGALVLITARPAYLSITQPAAYPGVTYFSSAEGWLVLTLMAVVTVVGTIAPLWFGWYRLDQHE